MERWEVCEVVRFGAFALTEREESEELWGLGLST